MAGFRFENLDIWEEGIEVSDLLFECANILILYERRKIIEPTEKEKSIRYY